MKFPDGYIEDWQEMQSILDSAARATNTGEAEDVAQTKVLFNEGGFHS